MPSQAWTTDQVGQWISSLGFPQYSKSFIDNNITGDVLVHLDHDDMSDIGVAKVGHRVRLLKSIYQMKEKEGVAGEPEGDNDQAGYVPPSIKSSEIDDYNRLFKSFEIRDERVFHVEQELKKLIESFNKIREDLLPLFKFVKESKPLPTPDGTNPIHAHYLHSPGTPNDSTLTPSAVAKDPIQVPSNSSSTTPSIVRKLSKLNNKSAQKSPTTMESEPTPTAGSSGTGAGTGPSEQKRPNLHLGSVKSLLSPSDSAVAATPVVTPGGSTTLQFSHPYQSGSAASSQVNFSNTSLVSPGAQPSSSNTLGGSGQLGSNNQSSSTPAAEPFKSFRVTLDDPCYKVLPAALRRYKINGDWKQYALLVCYGDQERLLGLEEKPLIIFKELQDAGKQPVFMLRHIEGMTQSGVVVGTPGGVL
ncbi:Protein STE50 [Yarrowia sp. C11]|nr:Protein STE50 [Yarrowia sp. C11]KAG5370778.1 Protein STE50 [Yarrowia sp. E02]